MDKWDELEFPKNGLSIDLLKAVYRNASIPLSVRMRAAIAALPHETPRLMVTAQVTENSFAELLDARIKKFEAMNNSNGSQVESKQIEAPTDARPHHSTTVDRRFRRM